MRLCNVQQALAMILGESVRPLLRQRCACVLMCV
jgi:hypothetical protein